MKSCMAVLLSLTIALAGLSIGCGEKKEEKKSGTSGTPSPTTQKTPKPTTRP